MARKTTTFNYASPEIQNEIIKIMSDEILRGVIENIKSAWPHKEQTHLSK